MEAPVRWTLIALISSATLLAGCSGRTVSPGSGPDGGAQTISLVGAGASFPYPLYSKWFSEYAKVDPGVQISYQSIGSGGGIQQLKARTVDFGASDAPLSDEEAGDMPGSVLHIPTVAGAVAVAYNLPGRERPLRLDGATLVAIYSGQAKRWNDPEIAVLNPGESLPDLPIVVVHRSDGSGTSYLFTSYLTAVSRDWAGKVGAGKSVNWPAGVGAKGNEGVTGIVKQTPGAIGYLELAYAEQNKLACAHLRNRAGAFIAPTVASTAAAAAGAAEAMEQDVRVSLVDPPGFDAYPIAGFTYLLVYQKQGDRSKAEALTRFLMWAVGDGQQHAEPLHYAPLPEAVVQINDATIRSLTFQGEPLL